MGPMSVTHPSTPINNEVPQRARLFGAQILLSSTWLRSAALVIAAMGAILLQWAAPQSLNAWNDRLTSRTWSLADTATQEQRVVVVDIDEKSVQALGPWPWPRERVAQLLTALDQQGVGLKVVDVLFDGQQAQDDVLNKALQQGSPSVIAQVFSLNPEPQVRTGTLSGALAQSQGAQVCAQGAAQAYGYLSPSASLLNASAGPSVGHITPIVDPDGTVRRVPALVCFEGKAYPALVVAALSAATGATPQWVHADGFWGPAHVLQLGDMRLPTNERAELMVSYRVPRNGFISVSAVDVLTGKVPEGLLKNVWALVGSTAMGAGDAVVTPQGGAVGGIEVHAQLLSAALDSRTPVVPAWSAVWVSLSALVSAVVLLGMLLWRRKAAAVVVPLAMLINLAGVFAVHAYALLAHQQVLAWGVPAIFVVLSSALVLVAEMLRVRFERERLFHNLSSYLPVGAARKVAFEGPSAQVKAQRQEATVMFVDLRNFSAYCEGRTPEDSATVLHLFYTTIDRIVSQHGGEVEQMVGDSIMAVWNGSTPCEQHAAKAVGAAVQIWQEGVAQLPRVASRKTPPLDFGIGIETGPVMVGSFGPAHRRAHAVLGETVTIAARLEGLTADLAYPILLGPEVVLQSGTDQAKPLGNFLLAGLSNPRKVHALPVPYDANHLHLAFSAEQDKAMAF
jgi:adenylate cyclase